MAEFHLLPQYPYDAIGYVKWTNITKWEELDFVKALPEEVKQQLRELPAEAEVEHSFCALNMRMMPRLNPERSREYWLQRYNQEYQPIREKNAKLAVIHTHNAFCQSVERSLARISETLELLNQNTKETQLEIKDLRQFCVEYGKYDSLSKSGRAPPWV